MTRFTSDPSSDPHADDEDRIEVAYDITPADLGGDAGGDLDRDDLAGDDLGRHRARRAGTIGSTRGGAGAVPPDPKMIVLVVVAFIAAGLVIVNLVRTDSPAGPSATSAATSTTPTGSTLTPSSIAPVEAFPEMVSVGGPLDWQIAPSTNPLSQYGVSVRSLAGATPGFVAIAGVDMTPFNPPVWTSVDGLTWTQVDPQTFGDYVAVNVIATNYAFFLQVRDAGRAIGSDQTGVHRLYRSWDLLTWELVDDDFAGDLAVGGGSFISRIRGDVLERSADGVTWAPLPNPFGNTRLLKSSVTRFGDVGFMFVVRGSDGKELTLVAQDPENVLSVETPPPGLSFVGLPGGVATMTDPARPGCVTELQRNLVEDGLDLTPDQATQNYQRCLADPVTSLLGPDGWQPIDGAPVPVGTVTTPQLVRVGNQLVAVVTDAEFALRLWTTPVDGIEWQESVAAVPGTASGLPRTPWVASSGERVVVIPNDYVYKDRIPIVVGNLS